MDCFWLPPRVKAKINATSRITPSGMVTLRFLFRKAMMFPKNPLTVFRKFDIIFLHEAGPR
jgi:hypothetical protein